MKSLQNRYAAIAAAAILAMAGSAALADRELRIDEAPVGEIDPAKATDFADTVLAINLYDTLVYPRQGGAGIQPLLATDWTIDGLEYTFNLRDDVIFNSGNPLSAADVVFSFNRMMAMGQGHSGQFEGRIDSVEAIDPHTVKFTLTGPFAPFLASLVRMPIVDSKLVSEHFSDGTHGEFGDYGSAWLSQNSAGSGAYVVSSHDPQTETVMTFNPNYFLEFSENFPERVRYRYGLDVATVRALMSRGQHDITSQWLPPEVLKALAAEGTTYLVNEGGLTGEYFQFNTRRPPLDDVHCRRALVYAFDYATMLNLVRINETMTQGVPMNGPLPIGLLGRDADRPDFAQDIERAREEIAQCRYAPGDHPIEIAWIAETPARERGALMMQALYSSLGFDVSITRTPWVLITEQVSNPDTAPHVIEIAIAALTPDPDSLLYNMYSSEVPHTWMSSSYLADDTVDELLNRGRTETDPQKRAEIYAEANALISDLAPGVFAYEFRGVFAVRNGVLFHNYLDPDRAFPLSGFGQLFKDIQINE